MDVEQFIELVRERPCLYDCNDPLHKNKKEKENHWKQIAAEMEITSELAKTKWKNLKDNYNKHLKSATQTSDSYVKYLHWGWAPNMEFLKKHLNFSTVDDHNKQEKHEIVVLKSGQCSIRSENRSEDIPDPKKLETMETQQDLLTPTRQAIQYFDNDRDISYNSLDATDLIFLGYAKAIKALSIRRQAEIKLRLAKMITEEELAQYEENSSYRENPVYYLQAPSPQNDPLNSKWINEVQIKSEEY